MQTDEDAFPSEENLRAEIIGRRVYCPRDMLKWERSEALADLVAFVGRMNIVAAAEQLHRPDQPGNNVSRASEVLQHVGEWARAGHGSSWCFFSETRVLSPSFREFHDRLRHDGPDLLSLVYRGCGPAGDYRHAELPVYLSMSFGDPDTMTYGPEHELSFCMFLVALFKLGRLTFADESYVIAVLFDKYVDIVDSLINSYRLEPSCTMYGNWDVNGFRSVAFVWGSAQLMAENSDHNVLTPAMAVTDEDIASKHRAKYVFMKCMDAVHRRAKVDDLVTSNGQYVEQNCEQDSEQVMKQDEEQECRRSQPTPLWRNSYQLWNLTALSRWDRVNGCLLAAFRQNVLDRFEVVCRLAFGELLKFTPNPRPPNVSFYDCCIPVAPMAFAFDPLPICAELPHDRVAEEELLFEIE